MLLLQIAAWLVVFAVKASTVAPTMPPRVVPRVDVDRVRVDAGDGQLTLCAVVDEPLDNRGAIDRLNRKLRGYARYAHTPDVFAAHGGANPHLLPRLVLVVARPTTAIERQNLRGVALQYRHAHIAFAIEGLDDTAS